MILFATDPQVSPAATQGIFYLIRACISEGTKDQLIQHKELRQINLQAIYKKLHCRELLLHERPSRYNNIIKRK